MSVSTIDKITAAGFQVGPPADDPCGRCPHRWGDHEVYAPLSPLDGGTISCPVDGCTCTGTWGVPQAETARRRLAEKDEEGS